MKVLYLRVSDDIGTEIRALAEQTGLSITRVAEIVICRGLNRPTTPEKIVNDILDGKVQE